jgi:hypothetical protein
MHYGAMVKQATGLSVPLNSPPVIATLKPGTVKYTPSVLSKNSLLIQENPHPISNNR